MTSKPIGAINGWWGALFKIAIATHPVILTALFACGAWLFLQVTNADKERSRLDAKVDAHIALPKHSNAVDHHTFDRLYNRLEKIEDKIDRMLKLP